MRPGQVLLLAGRSCSLANVLAVKHTRTTKIARRPAIFEDMSLKIEGRTTCQSEIQGDTEGCYLRGPFLATRV